MTPVTAFLLGGILNTAIVCIIIWRSQKPPKTFEIVIDVTNDSYAHAVVVNHPNWYAPGVIPDAALGNLITLYGRDMGLGLTIRTTNPASAERKEHAV